ncbi:hypothetical protein AMAG_15590 [Allomyces macrogynus ATCC 38327]|uniref:Uncharacterized protein n=1 Tax=Allomyces macrogynus (strain ATCC 38327) TaxID=578462 RepID=A0A0L0T9D2_ALLM3|nr:hypothetical protein AMAG_15590 [Allomyces macrogynus ATCC 38327]|eukprot:KNE71357.1 hypothetical protein AMAG_15590 [Allomyces macrogynus ATCC 38327]
MYFAAPTPSPSPYPFFTAVAATPTNSWPNSVHPTFPNHPTGTGAMCLARPGKRKADTRDAPVAASPTAAYWTPPATHDDHPAPKRHRPVPTTPEISMTVHQYDPTTQAAPMVVDEEPPRTSTGDRMVDAKRLARVMGCEREWLAPPTPAWANDLVGWSRAARTQNVAWAAEAEGVVPTVTMSEECPY